MAEEKEKIVKAKVYTEDGPEQEAYAQDVRVDENGTLVVVIDTDKREGNLYAKGYWTKVYIR